MDWAAFRAARGQIRANRRAAVRQFVSDIRSQGWAAVRPTITQRRQTLFTTNQGIRSGVSPRWAQAVARRRSWRRS
jgi:hypothetical protein